MREKQPAPFGWVPKGLVVAMAVGGSAAVAYGTAWGPWVGSDSVEYFESARNLAEGRGLVLERASGTLVPLSLRPPLYPIALVVFNLLGLDLLVAARILAISLFFIFLLVIGTSIVKLTDEPAIGLIALLLIASSPATLHVFSGAMSEALFLVLSMLSIFTALFFLDKPRDAYFVAAAFVAGLSMVTRYGGLAVIAASLAVCLANSGRPKEKLEMVGKFGAISSAPFLLWIWYVASLGGAPGRYHFDLNQFWANLAPARIGFVETVWAWLPILPAVSTGYRAKVLVLLVIALASAIVVSRLAQMQREGRHSVNGLGGVFRLIVAFAGFALIYSIFIALAFAFVISPKPAINERILLPIQVCLYVLLPAVAVLILRALKKCRWSLPVSIGIALPVVVANIGPTTMLLSNLHTDGGGYLGRAWRGSGVIEIVQHLPRDVQLISSDVAAVMFYTGRAAFGIPELDREIKRTDYYRFGDDTAEALELMFREKQALLVLFASSYWQFNAIYGENTDKRLEAFTEGLSICASSWDGTVYAYGDCP